MGNNCIKTLKQDCMLNTDHKVLIFMVDWGIFSTSRKMARQIIRARMVVARHVLARLHQPT
jgi:hypothetical protein